MLSAESYRQFQEEVAALGAVVLDDTRYSALTSIPQLLAFYFKTLRDDGKTDEEAVDRIEIFVRHLDLKPQEARDHAATLRRVGFTSLATRLKWLAGRRQRGLRPLQ